VGDEREWETIMKNPVNHGQRPIWSLPRSYARLQREDSRTQEGNTTESELEEHFKRQVHISWNEAWRAEKEREKARLTSCNEIPTAGPLTLLAVNIARELPNIKARAFRYFSRMSLKRRSGHRAWQKPALPSKEKREEHGIPAPSALGGSGDKAMQQEPNPRNQ
jgi:hypothetical protein